MHGRKLSSHLSLYNSSPLAWTELFFLSRNVLHNSPFPKRQSLDVSRLKEFADDSFEFDENGTKFSKRVEDTVGKGEIARYEQFLFFPAVFSKDLYCSHVKTMDCLGKG